MYRNATELEQLLLAKTRKGLIPWTAERKDALGRADGEITFARLMLGDSRLHLSPAVARSCCVLHLYDRDWHEVFRIDAHYDLWLEFLNYAEKEAAAVHSGFLDLIRMI
jgi:hypothetical protein